MAVEASSFIYPWDLADLGTERSLRRFRDDGFKSFDLTACYHPITTFVPGGAGRRLMEMDEGAVFYPASVQRFGRIKPRLWHEPEVLRTWQEASDASSQLGLDLNAWVVALYQPWIARDYPDCARVLPTGQRVTAGVCPASPDVQEFLATLVSEIASRTPIRAVQLEGVTFPNFDTGWRAGAGTRMLVELGQWSRWLLGLCFCPSCSAAAKSAGINVQTLRNEIKGKLFAAYQRGEARSDPPFQDAHNDWLTINPDYAAFLRLRDEACVRLVTRISKALKEAAPTAQLGIWGPDEFTGTRLNLDDILPLIGILQTRHGLIAPDNARAARAIADAHPGMRVKAVHWCGGFVGPPFGPEFERALRATAELPADIMHLMNWALLPPRIASSIVPLLRNIEATVGGTRVAR